MNAVLLPDTLTQHIKEAMRALDKKKLSALRFIASKFKQHEVDTRTPLTHEICLTILTRLLKQHKESLVHFEQAKRADLVAQTQYEIEIITTYLPIPLSEAEITSLIQQAIATTSAHTMKDMGKVMGWLTPPLQNRADLAQVSKMVKSLLGG